MMKKFAYKPKNHNLQGSPIFPAVFVFLFAVLFSGCANGQEFVQDTQDRPGVTKIAVTGGVVVSDTVTPSVNDAKTNEPLPTFEADPGEQTDNKDKTEQDPEEEYGKVLRINEILATNDEYNKHNDGFFDMVEIYNASNETLKLSDYFLSDSKKHLTDYPLPNIELNPGEYTVVYCTGDYYKKTEEDMPFKLSYSGEKLYIADKSGNILDKVKYPKLPKNMSYGVGPDGTYMVYDTPTVGSGNTYGYKGILPEPETNVLPGTYDGTVSITLKGEGTIRYTLDGTEPNDDSPVYDGKPIRIGKTCSIRAFQTKDGYLKSFTKTFDYLISEPDYELDVVVVTMDENDFKTMYDNYNKKTKYRANIALISGGQQKFSEDCAICVFGATSREYLKKSYRIKFSADYGAPNLEYKVFDDLDIDEFDSLVLRSGSQDNEAALMRDEYISSLSLSSGFVDDVLIQAYKPVNLYVNDEYVGIYYIREHIDDDMIASHKNCEKEEVTLIEQMQYVKSGSEAREWLDLWEYIKDHDLKNEESYSYIKDKVDLNSVADYYIIQLWAGNIDMDNVRVAKCKGGKWFFVLYDLDLCLTRTPEGTCKDQLGTMNSGFYTFNALIYRLLENDDFMKLFCERMEVMMSTVYSDENAISYIDDLAKVLRHDMAYNCERWYGVEDPSGDMVYRDLEGWERALRRLKENVTGRAERVINDFMSVKGRGKTFEEWLE